MDQPTAEQALRRLEPLVGEWAVEASWPDGTAWPGGGTVTFEWHESGAHLVERGTVDLAEAPDNLSIIGCDAANGTYFQLYSDERGVCRVYQMSIDEGVWRLWRDGEPFSQRFEGTVAGAEPATRGIAAAAADAADAVRNARRLVPDDVSRDGLWPWMDPGPPRSACPLHAAGAKGHRG